MLLGEIMMTPIRLRVCQAGILWFLCFSAFAQLRAQCTDTLNFVVVVNAACGGNNGDIILGMNKPSSQYQFNWSPNVSNNNAAAALSAGVYYVTITRTDNPACVIDTLVIVDEAGAPAFSINQAQSNPADCLAANGKITLQPSNLYYQWSNGETGFQNENLPAGTYIVTATLNNSASACKNLEVVRVGGTNTLSSSFGILKKPKCGKSNGKVEIFTTGGSGNYTYNGNSSPIIDNLSAGTHFVTVTDVFTACQRVLEIPLENLEVSGMVNTAVFPQVCPGGPNGYLEISVIPGANFALPYAFTLSANGNPFSPGNLPAGLYDLVITDADGCSLNPKLVQMPAPAPFQLQPQISPATCTQGGQIQLNLSGGTGPYVIDWSDVPGIGQPANRSALAPGIYSGIAYDSLFCSIPFGPYLIDNQCNKTDTTHLLVPVGESRTYCLNVPPGATPGAYVLTTGGASGSSARGQWQLQNGNCLKYTAGNTPGFAVDTICIRSFFPAQSFLNDTFCVIVTITALPPSQEWVYLNVPVGQSATQCGQIPQGFSQPVLVPAAGTAALQGATPYGQYNILTQNACLNYTAGNVSGYGLDTLCVGVYDANLQQAHIICYILNILSAANCQADFIQPGSFNLVTAQCDVPASVCIPGFPFDDLPKYAVLDGNSVYNGGYFPCDEHPVTTYQATQMPLGPGPYELIGWVVNGQFFDGNFPSLSALVNLMNQLDPQGNWSITNNYILSGGNAANNYGPMEVKNAAGVSGTLLPQVATVADGVELRLLPGFHQLVFTQSANGCSDTLDVQVICLDCPPVFNYPLPPNGIFKWKISACDLDTVFCTNIPLGNLNQYTILKNGQPFSQFSNCGDKVGLLLEAGNHQFEIQKNGATCSNFFKVEVTCDDPNVPVIMANYDEYLIPRVSEYDLDILQNDLIFGIPGNLGGLANFELLSAPDLGTAQYQAQEGILKYFIESGKCGIDTFTYRITDTLGNNSSAPIQVTIACDNLLIFTGISPNGDGKNDVWHLLGIEDFPANEVQVFNRWGLEVYRKKGYDNQQPWDGSWQGRQLPDGPYYYVVTLGKNEKPRKGVLYITR
jgi:gliding motility-associated-like protein